MLFKFLFGCGQFVFPCLQKIDIPFEFRVDNFLDHHLFSIRIILKNRLLDLIVQQDANSAPPQGKFNNSCIFGSLQRNVGINPFFGIVGNIGAENLVFLPFDRQGHIG